MSLRLSERLSNYLEMQMNPTNIHALEVALSQAGAIRYGQHRQETPAHIAEIARDAVQCAITLRRMARAAKQIGFLALPLDQYLSRLARHAEVELDGILSPAHGSQLAERLSPWVALAGRLQLATENVRLWVRAWFAAEFHVSLATNSVMARGESQLASARHFRQTLGVQETASPQNVEVELERTESRYTPAHRAELETVLRTLV
jgi:hypothetical protein